MNTQINTIATNLMNANLNNQQHHSSPKSHYIGVSREMMEGGNEAGKEQDLSTKNHLLGGVDMKQQQQALRMIEKQENNNTENLSSSHADLSLNNFGAPTQTDNQYFIPMHHLNSSHLTSTTALPPSFLSPHHPSTIHPSSLDLGMDEASKKREQRLLKNKEAAKECRRKKKEYVRCLENRVNLLENQNKNLIEELKLLKELYSQKDTQS